MLLDIVILPPAKLRDRIGKKILKETKDYPVTFVVDNKHLIPHLSLFHLRTSKERFNKIGKELKQIIKSQVPLKIESVDFISYKLERGIMEFTVKNHKELSGLYKRIYKRVYLYKTGMMPQSKIIGLWKGEQLKQAKKYGRPLWFGPHFTMARLKRMPDVLRLVKKMKKMKFKFVANEIYICEVNQWWQVTKIIKKFKIGK